jgi:hypothetical protein
VHPGREPQPERIRRWYCPIWWNPRRRTLSAVTPSWRRVFDNREITSLIVGPTRAKRKNNPRRPQYEPMAPVWCCAIHVPTECLLYPIGEIACRLVAGPLRQTRITPETRGPVVGGGGFSSREPSRREGCVSGGPVEARDQRVGWNVHAAPALDNLRELSSPRVVVVRTRACGRWNR